MVFCFSVLCGFTIDKQKIENETKKQTQRDSTIEVLEEQLQLWTAKVSKNRMRCLCIATLFTQSPTRWMNEWIASMIQLIRYFVYVLFFWSGRRNKHNKFTSKMKRNWKKCSMVSKNCSGLYILFLYFSNYVWNGFSQWMFVDIENSMNFGYIRWNKAQVPLAGVLVQTRLFQIRVFCTNFTWIAY